MKAKLAMLLAGIVLGSSGFGYAASQSYWKESQGPYKCQGEALFVICKMNGTAWNMYMKRTVGREDGLAIFRGGKVIFSCMRTDLPVQCIDYRR